MIEVQDLHKGFGAQTVLEGVSFKIEKGETVMLVGRSGCGKSVLLKHLAGLLSPDAGKVLIAGENLCGKSERELLRIRRKFGVLFQGAALFDSMTVEENISFLLRREGKLSAKEISERVDEVLAVVQLPGTRDKKPSELSGGMRKRVGLARAIIYRPEIILYDEPTTGLDPVVSDSIDKMIHRVAREFDVTSIVVTHDIRSMRRVGERIIMLANGKIYADDTPENVFSSKDTLIHNFVNGISEDKEIDF